MSKLTALAERIGPRIIRLVKRHTLWTSADLVNILTTRRGYSVERDVAFGPLPRQRLDVYRPHGAGRDTAVVVFFHGGAWSYGGKDDYRFVGQALTAAGFIAVVPNYRLWPEAAFPAFVEDGAAAVAWTAGHFRDGRGRQAPLFLFGHSAGAHIAALLTLDRRYFARVGLTDRVLAATVGLSGPYDFLPLPHPHFEGIFPEATRAESQPVAFARADAPPMLLVTGANDRTVDPRNSERLAELIRQRGGRVELRLYPEVSHIGALASMVTRLHFQRRLRADMMAFLRSHLPAAAPGPAVQAEDWEVASTAAGRPA